jgi:hypothetical protein
MRSNGVYSAERKSESSVRGGKYKYKQVLAGHSIPRSQREIVRCALVEGGKEKDIDCPFDCIVLLFLREMYGCFRG